MKIKRIIKSRRNQISSAPPSSIPQPQQQQESVEQYSSILPQLLDGPDVTEEQKQLILKRVLEVRSKYNAFVEKDVCQKVPFFSRTRKIEYSIFRLKNFFFVYIIY